MGIKVAWSSATLFDTIEQAQDKATRWLWKYNHERPNMARWHHVSDEAGDGRLAPLLATAKSGGITVELATLDWVSWFNHKRLLAPTRYIPPEEAEANHYRQQASLAEATWLKRNSRQKSRAIQIWKHANKPRSPIQRLFIFEAEMGAFGAPHGRVLTMSVVNDQPSAGEREKHELAKRREIAIFTLCPDYACLYTTSPAPPQWT